MRLIRCIYISIVCCVASAFGSFANDAVSIKLDDYEAVRPKIALVLSGGGARSLSQIGVLEELVKAGIQIDYIVGTSMGSIVGGLYASGYQASELDSIVKQLNWQSLITLKKNQDRGDLFIDQKQIEDRSLLTLRFKKFRFVVPEAISAGSEFNTILQRIFLNSLYHSDKNYDKLRVPFRAVATDLLTGESVSQKSGNIIKAVRASSTLPLRYTPVRKDSMLFIDGGILANIPVKEALEFNPDIIIAVNNTSPLFPDGELNTPWNIADQAISISMKKFAEEAMAMADFVITPKIGNHRNTDFTGLDSLIDLGRKAASPLLDSIKNYINQKYAVSRGYDWYRLFMNTPSNPKRRIYFTGFDTKDSIELANSMILRDEPKIKNTIEKLLCSGEYSSIEMNFDSTTATFNALSYPKLSKIAYPGLATKEVAVYIEQIENSYRGAPLRKAIITEIKEKVLKKFRDLGFSMANINSTEIDSNGNMTLNIDEGRIYAIKIHGNESTSGYLIKREIKYKQGEPINAEKLFKGWNNLKSTDLFTSIDFEIVPLDTGVGNVLIVNVIEGGTQTIRIGGRVDNERYAQGSFDAIQENLWNLGVRVGVGMYGGQRNQKYIGYFENPRIMNTDISLKARGYYETRNIRLFENVTGLPTNKFERKSAGEDVIERYGGVFSVGSQIDRSGMFEAMYRLEKQRTFNNDSSTKGPYANISTLKISTVFDSEDRADFPTKGSIFDFGLETSLFKSATLGSFSKVYFLYNYTVSFDEHTIRPQFFFGSGDKTMPKGEFFSLGGENSFYGLSEDEERGRQIMKASLEYRYKAPFKLFFDTYFSFRYDIGSLWLQPDEIRFADLKHGTGVSIQFDTPLGPAKFSLGRSFYFKSEPNEIVRGAAHGYFSIGLKL